MKRPHLYLLLTGTLLGLPAAAAESFVQSPAYKECTQLASSNPGLALQKAESWLKAEQSTSALHCRAMALYGLRQYELSAAALADVRNTLVPTNITLRSFVARQASRAWLNAGKPDAAIASLSAQITELSPQEMANAYPKLSSELLVDRARLRANSGQLTDAIQDLDHAISLTPDSEDVLLERADVLAKLGDGAQAKRDLQAVLRLNPKHEQALERMRNLRDTAPQKS